MKSQSLFVIVLLASFAFMACNPAAESLEATKAIQTDWAGATTQVGEFATKAANEYANWEAMYKGMYVNEDAQEPMPEALQAKLDSLKSVCKGHGESYQSLQNDVTAFTEKWGTNGKKLNSLVATLEKGNVPSDIDQLVTGFEANIKDGATQLGMWEEKLTATKEACFETCQTYARLADTPNPAIK
ncbi:MAG: hypothetical protein AAGI38_16750 [Bacteroidota bacterium]